MHLYESVPSITISYFDDWQLWFIAVLCFGIGDVVTTSIGLRLAGVTEMHPLAVHAFQYSTLGAMVVLKSIVFGSCYLLWKWTPRPHCMGVPLGLAILGMIITVWNLQVLLLALIL